MAPPSPPALSVCVLREDDTTRAGLHKLRRSRSAVCRRMNKGCFASRWLCRAETVTAWMSRTSGALRGAVEDAARDAVTPVCLPLHNLLPSCSSLDCFAVQCRAARYSPRMHKKNRCLHVRASFAACSNAPQNSQSRVTHLIHKAIPLLVATFHDPLLSPQSHVLVPIALCNPPACLLPRLLPCVFPLLCVCPFRPPLLSVCPFSPPFYVFFFCAAAHTHHAPFLFSRVLRVVPRGCVCPPACVLTVPFIFSCGLFFSLPLFSPSSCLESSASCQLEKGKSTEPASSIASRQAQKGNLNPLPHSLLSLSLGSVVHACTAVHCAIPLDIA